MTDGFDLALSNLRRGPWNGDDLNDVFGQVDAASPLGTQAAEAALDGYSALDALPALPDDDYPAGKIVVLNSNGVAYRNVADEWVAYAPSVGDPGNGLIVLEGNTNPSTGSVGPQNFLTSAWTRYVQNGDFHDAPPDPLSPIDNTTNPLPGWALVSADAQSEADTTVMWVSDASSGSGGHVEIEVDTAAVVSRYLVSTPIHFPTTTTRNSGLGPIFSVDDDGLAFGGIQVQGFLDWLKTDQVTTTGTEVSIGTLGVGTLRDMVPSPRFSTAPADAGYAQVKVGVITSGAATTTVTINEVRVVEALPELGFVDPDFPDTTAALFMNSESWRVRVGGNVGGQLQVSESAVTTIAALRPAILVIPNDSTPDETEDGSVEWDNVNDHMTVGTGSGRVTLLDTGSSTFAAPSLTLGTANAAGAATTVIRSDATILAFDATTPAAIGTAAVGAATVAPRRDHVHATGAGTPTTSAVGDAAATGTGPAAAMTNHVHGRESFGSSAAAIGTSSAGAATTPSRSDHVHATGAGTPAAVSTANATGTGPAAAMTDHVHAHETAHVAHDTIFDAAGDLVQGTGSDTAAKLAISVPAANILNVVGVVNGETSWSVKSVHDGTSPAAVGTAAAGTALTSAHRDHVHATGAGTPTTQAFGDAAAVGTGPAASMTDHKHAWPALGTTAAAIGTSAGGSATTPSKSDHVHATGAGTPSTQAFGDAAATGTGPAAAMTDHKHAMPAAPTAASVGASANPHGAADHTDITRYIWLSAAEAKLDSGTAATLGTAPNIIPLVALADSAIQGCYWAFTMPNDYTSGSLVLRVYWVPGSTDASVHSVRWSFVTKSVALSGDVTAAGTTVAVTGTAAARTINLLVGNDTVTDSTVTPTVGHTVMLNVRRTGNDAVNDTYVGVVNLVGVRVEYTASQ